MTFVVIKTGGKQYKVSLGDKLVIEKLDQTVGSQVVFNEVLLLTDDQGVAQIGTPLVSGAQVEAKILEQFKDDKKIVFKYSSKTRYKKKKGHRQPLTKVEITKITP